MSDFETEFIRRNALSHVLSMARCLNDRHFPDMRRTAEERLTRHLPSLRAEDREWVNPEEIGALTYALSVRTPALTVAILGALGQVGDRRAIWSVEQLIQDLYQKPQASDSEDGVIFDAASKCLERLREHADRTKQANVLLRGAQQPVGDQQSILLRAASKAESTASTELLRPDDSPECRDVLRKEKANDLPF